MMSELRGYLALGDREYWEGYLASERAFRADLAALEGLKPDFDALNAAGSTNSRRRMGSGPPCRPPLRLRNDQLEREPAYRLLATDGVRSAGQVLIHMNSLIDAPREASDQSVAQLQEMAQFEASFAPCFPRCGVTRPRATAASGRNTKSIGLPTTSVGARCGASAQPAADQQQLLEEVRQSARPSSACRPDLPPPRK